MGNSYCCMSVAKGENNKQAAIIRFLGQSIAIGPLARCAPAPPICTSAAAVDDCDSAQPTDACHSVTWWYGELVVTTSSTRERWKDARTYGFHSIIFPMRPCSVLAAAIACSTNPSPSSCSTDFTSPPAFSTIDSLCFVNDSVACR